MKLLGRFRTKKADTEVIPPPVPVEHILDEDEEQKRAREIVERQLEEQRQHLPGSRE